MQGILTGSIGAEAASRCGAASKTVNYLNLTGLNPTKLPQPAPFQTQGFITTVSVAASSTANSAQQTGTANPNSKSGAPKQSVHEIIAISFGLLYLIL
jgi:hypothetical protein